MNSKYTHMGFVIATVFTVALLFNSCESKDQSELLGIDSKVFPQGVAKNFKLYYNEYKGNKSELIAVRDTTSLSAILEAQLSEDYQQLIFPYRIFPEGIRLTLIDDDGARTYINADYGKLYVLTSMVDLRGSVLIELPDGSTLETDQLYWDRENDWVFTDRNFKYTNREDNSIMNGKGMDFKRDFTYFNAHQTYGTMVLKEE